ncbi:hypothetical protein CYANOKiyG1_22500 [Okeania sp. KiyG1]|nr:hypothetical protein CYANOKiyG1_22500 [Okeania sp. KiyG1]
MGRVGKHQVYITANINHHISPSLQKIILINHYFATTLICTGVSVTRLAFENLAELAGWTG